MKKKILNLVTIFLMLTINCFAFSKTSTNYDKYSGLTVNSTRDFHISSLLIAAHIYFSASIFKTEDLPENRYSFKIYSRSPQWRFLRAKTMFILADGKRFVIDKVINSDSKVGNLQDTWVTETITFEVSEQVFLEIANAKTVEARIGSDTFKLKENALTEMRDLISTCKENQ